MERPLKRIPNLLQQSRRQQRLKPDQPTAVLQILEAVILEIATVEHLKAAILETATVEAAILETIAETATVEAAIPETIAEVATVEAAIAETATVEVATTKAVISETATAKVQHQAVIVEVLHRVLIMAIATVEIQVQMEQCQFRIMPFLEIRHLVIIQEQVEMAEEIPQMDRILIFDDATPNVKEAEYV